MLLLGPDGRSGGISAGRDGERAGVRGGKTLHHCNLRVRARAKWRRGGSQRRRPPGGLEEWGFPGADLRAETKAVGSTGEQHEVLGETVHRHRALRPGRLLPSQPARPRTTSVPSAATPPPASVNTGFLSGPGAVTQHGDGGSCSSSGCQVGTFPSSVLRARMLVKQALLVSLEGGNPLKRWIVFFFLPA